MNKDMQYTTLGKTDIAVSKMCVGAMNFWQTREYARLDTRLFRQ